MSSTEDEDLPSLSVLDNAGGAVKKKEYYNITIEQLVKDKKLEIESEYVHNELRNFDIDDSGSEIEEETGLVNSQDVPETKEVLAYGMKFLKGPEELPQPINPPKIQELCPGNEEADLLTLIPWGPIIKDLFDTPAHYHVWLFGLACYSKDVEVSNQATYLLMEEFNVADQDNVYNPTAVDICAVFNDYGGYDELGDMELVTIYERKDPPSYYTNIKNALKIYSCAKELLLNDVMTVVKLITRLCQDQYVTTILDPEDYGDILSNILDGLGTFNSHEIDEIAQVMVNQVKNILIAPYLCQVVQSGNTRCHLIIEQVTFLLLLRYSGTQISGSSAATAISRDAERPELHHVIRRIAEQSHETHEFGAVTTILDYHINMAVLNRDQLSEVLDALHILFGEIKELDNLVLSSHKTRVLTIVCCVFKRMHSDSNTLDF